MATAYAQAPANAIWIVREAESLAPLLATSKAANDGQRLVLLEGVPDITLQVLHARFRHIVAAVKARIVLLDANDLASVLVSSHPDELFIGGGVDVASNAVLLYRGNVEPLIVPLSWFANTQSRSRVNPKAFAIIDHGQTVRLGAFEAAASAILYEFDADYRRRTRKREIAEANSFGASIRRLRLQKGLSRADFPGISEKSIARIERDEVSRPRAATLQAIARVLGVRREQLSSY